MSIKMHLMKSIEEIWFYIYLYMHPINHFSIISEANEKVVNTTYK